MLRETVRSYTGTSVQVAITIVGQTKRSSFLPPKSQEA